MFWKNLSLKTKFLLAIGALAILTFLILISIINIQNCQHQNQIEELQRQILEKTDYAVEQVDKNTAKIDTIKTSKSISKEEVSEEIAKQLKKNHLDAVYTAQVNGMLNIEKQIKGQTKPAQVVEHNNT